MKFLIKFNRRSVISGYSTDKPETSKMKMILGINIPLLKVDLNMKLVFFGVSKHHRSERMFCCFWPKSVLNPALIGKNLIENQYKYEKHKIDIQVFLNKLLKITVKVDL